MRATARTPSDAARIRKTAMDLSVGWCHSDSNTAAITMYILLASPILCRAPRRRTSGDPAVPRQISRPADREEYGFSMCSRAGRTINASEAASRRRVAASGSAARMISPITAIPRAPAARQAAMFLSSMPPSATTGPGRAGRLLPAHRARPPARSRACSASENRAQRRVIGAGGELRGGLLRRVRRHADQPGREQPARRAGSPPPGRWTPSAPAETALDRHARHGRAVTPPDATIARSKSSRSSAGSPSRAG